MRPSDQAKALVVSPEGEISKARRRETQGLCVTSADSLRLRDSAVYCI
jgi:hypothetical protein